MFLHLKQVWFEWRLKNSLGNDQVCAHARNKYEMAFGELNQLTFYQKKPKLYKKNCFDKADAEFYWAANLSFL